MHRQTTTTEITQTGGYFDKYTCSDRLINQSLRPTGTHAIILLLWGF